MHKQRDFKTTRFTKRICLTPDHYEFINFAKKSSSAAGLLEHIIEQYIQSNKKEIV